MGNQQSFHDRTNTKYFSPAGEASRTIKVGNNSISPKFRRRRRRQRRAASSNKEATTTFESNHGSNTTTISSCWIHANQNVESVYDLHEIIAHGHLGQVRICSKKRVQHSNHTGHFVMIRHNKSAERTKGSYLSGSSNANNNNNNNTSSHQHTYHRLYVCKSMSLARVQRGQQENLVQELTRLHELPLHAHLATLHQLYFDKRNIWIILELCTGGDLYTRMDTNSDELDVANVLEQVADALVWLHSHDLTHANLKLENILYEHGGDDAGVKLVDFGISRRFGDHGCGDVIRTVCGAEYATAPEVYDTTTDATTTTRTIIPPSADIWSMGAIAFILLSGGTFPFGESDIDVDRERLESATFTFGDEWRDTSETARTFCQQCFQLDSSQRWTALQALEYTREWIKELQASGLTRGALRSPEPEQVMDVSLRGAPPGFGLHGQPRKRLLQCLAMNLNKSQLNELQQVFLEFDLNRSGVLTLQQVKMAVKQYCKQQQSSDLTKDDVKEMFQGLHHHHHANAVTNVSIEYEPFLKAVVQMQDFMTLESIGEELDRFDRQGTGQLGADEVKHILEANGCDMDLVNRLLEAHETNDGMVEYDVLTQRLFRDY